MVISRAAVRDMSISETSARVFVHADARHRASRPSWRPSWAAWVLDAAGLARHLLEPGGLRRRLPGGAVALKLPETTRPRPARPALGQRDRPRCKRRLLGHRGFVGFALAGGLSPRPACSPTSLGSPSVFITLHTPRAKANMYGVLFGLNAAGLIAASQLNGHLLKRDTT